MMDLFDYVFLRSPLRKLASWQITFTANSNTDPLGDKIWSFAGSVGFWVDVFGLGKGEIGVSSFMG